MIRCAHFAFPLDCELAVRLQLLRRRYVDGGFQRVPVVLGRFGVDSTEAVCTVLVKLRVCSDPPSRVPFCERVIGLLRAQVVV